MINSISKKACAARIESFKKTKTVTLMTSTENLFRCSESRIMEIHPGLKPALYGAVGGAIALAIVGFTWGGWVTGGTHQQRAQQTADNAVIAVLAPICADRFRQQAGADASLVELKKISSWQQGGFIEKGGWATFKGERADSGVARACATLLLA